MSYQQALQRVRASPRLNVSLETIVGLVAALIVVYLLFVPLGMLLFSSVRATKGVLPFEATTLTLDNFAQIYGSSLTYRLFWNTLQYTVVAILIGLGLAVFFAWFLERTNAPAPTLLIALILAPLGLPAIVEAMAWILIANPSNGVLNQLLRSVFGLGANAAPVDIYSILGIGFVSGVKMVPAAYILVSSVMLRLDPALEEASLASGASPFATFARVTAALMRPAVLAIVIYFGVMTIDVFEVPALLGMPKGIFVFSTLIYQATHPATGLANYGLASGYGVLSLAVASVLIYLYHRQVRRQEQFAVVTGKGYRPRRWTLRKRWQALFVAVIVIYSLMSAVLPALVLIWASLGILYTPWSLHLASLDAYLGILISPDMDRAVGNTAVVSITSATAAMVLALLTSWLALRSRLFARSLPDRLTILAIAMPSIVIALALLFFYSRFPLPIYGTVWIIVIALVTRHLAYTARLMNAAYLQIHRELEEASAASGAPWLSTMTRIVLPILWPAFIRGWLWVFVLALRDVTLSLMLFTVYNETVGVRLWQVWMNEANFKLGAAIAVPLMLLSVGLSLLVVKTTIQVREVQAL